MPVVGVEAQATGLLCVFSDTMTKETKVLSTTEFMSLDEDATEWANVILNKYNIENLNKNSGYEIQKNGFDIKREAIKLENLYMKKKKCGDEKI